MFFSLNNFNITDLFHLKSHELILELILLSHVWNYSILHNGWQNLNVT